MTVTVSDSDGDSIAYSRDFGDGAIGTGNTVPGGGTITANHAYAAVGTYAVTLRVEDGRGGTSTKSVLVSVTSPPPVVLIGGVAAGIAVAIAGWLLFLRRRRSS